MEIPPNTRSVVTVPVPLGHVITEGGATVWTGSQFVGASRGVESGSAAVVDGEGVTFEVGSGIFDFRAQLR